MTKIRAVAFDLDGLMFNTEDVFDLAGDALLRRRGLRMTDEIRRGMLGRRPPEAFAHLIKMTGITEPVEQLRIESKELFMNLLDAHLKPMPALFELLDHLEGLGIPKGVATSSPRAYMEHLLGRFDLLPRFVATRPKTGFTIPVARALSEGRGPATRGAWGARRLARSVLEAFGGAPAR